MKGKQLPLHSAPANTQEKQFKDRLNTSEIESIFLSTPTGSSAHAAAKLFGSRPHLAGSAQDFEDAKELLKIFQREDPDLLPIYDAGSTRSRAATISLASRLLGPKKPTAWIDTYYPEMDTPSTRSLELINPDSGEPELSFDLVEDGDSGDEDAAEYRDAVPAWHGFSGDGEAEGELVYVNYGTYDDFEEVLAQGVDIKGKIVIVRYGAIYRGLKVKRAEDLGASGILIYSDPRDDGYVTTSNGFTPYPQGPARNPTSIQRGSVMYLSFGPGDPTTPGRPAYPDASRDPANNTPKIPSLPISWANAQRLLEEIGEAYTEDGKLSGKISAKKVKMVNHVNRSIIPIWNTMAAIPGHVKDEIILVGCHRDAWVLGGADPVSGTASLHEIVRGFGELLRQGWQPMRTVVFASWDAEEQGLIGSTEYGEDFDSFLSSHVVAYINVDVSSSGSRWQSVASDVKYGDKTLWDARQAEGPFIPSVADVAVIQAYESKKETLRNEEANGGTGVDPLGSGSDYTVFLQRIGIASTDQGFGGTPYDAPYHYHSIYDTVRWQEVYADPGYEKHVAVAQHLGLMALRLTDSIILPLNTTQYAFELEKYLDQVESLPVPSSLDVETENRLALDFSPLRASFQRLQKASLKLDKEKREAEEKFRDVLERMPKFPRLSHSRHECGGPLSKLFRGISRRTKYAIKTMFGVVDENPTREFIKAAKRVSRANKKLMGFERGFIHEEGIREREWFRHLGVAPGKWLGYGATTLPALTEAIQFDKDVGRAKYEVGRLVTLIDKMVEGLKPEDSERD
ncbi:Zn-dependent exopeptidase [Dendrothele bispora CBS 962.96]|uniref:Zn-dependent exopeptidase n=1 Tax=Dendrothele bispora (strain CBS 962.96) TaxID=1314807 RepID=A0A4S8LXN6_DENBC|nr:Zn-dependent exopeptidase [Dendrothele bispora CBS 962.96]